MDNVLFAQPGLSTFDWLAVNSGIRAPLFFFSLSD